MFKFSTIGYVNNTVLPVDVKDLTPWARAVAIMPSEGVTSLADEDIRLVEAVLTAGLVQTTGWAFDGISLNVKSMVPQFVKNYATTLEGIRPLLIYCTDSTKRVINCSVLGELLALSAEGPWVNKLDIVLPATIYAQSQKSVAALKVVGDVYEELEG